MPWKDRAGTPIVEGAEVAYNMSGNVVRGRVLATTRSHAKIALDPRFNRGYTPHVSKVRRSGSILVLKEPA